MAELGLVIQKGQVEFIYGELGAVVFSQTGGDFLTWVKSVGIAMDTITHVIVQKDFCEELSQGESQAGSNQLKIEELRQRQLASFHQADQMTPDTELIRNQMTRENYWTLNLMLSQRIEDFVVKLRGKLTEVNCKAPIYFLRGSGYLTDAKNVMKNPVLTWRSKEALELRSAADHHMLHDFIYVNKHKDEYALSVVKNGEVVVYKNRCSFKGYELPPWFVKITRVQESDLESAMSYLRKTHGALPLVCQGDFKEKGLEFHRYTAQRNPMSGLFQIPYRKRIFRQMVMDQKSTVKEAEVDLQEKMEYYLRNNQVGLVHAEFTINRENLQYSLDRIVRLELRVVGRVSEASK